MHMLLGAAAIAVLAGAAEAAPLTYEEALALAGTDAPSVVGRGLAVQAARTTARAAAALPDPRLEFGFEGFPVSGPNAFDPSRDDFSAVRIGIAQDIPNLAKRRARAERAAAETGSAAAELRGETRRVQLAAGLAWIDLHFADARLAALDKIAAAIAPLVASAPARMTSGSLRPAEALNPRRLAAELDDRRSTESAVAARAAAELSRWTGDPSPTAIGPLPPMTVDTASLRSGLDILPNVAVAQALSVRAAADVRLAEAERRPDWGVQASYARRDPRFGDMVGAGITVSLPFWKRNRQEPLAAAKVLTAQAAVLEAEAARRAAAAALAGDLADHAMHHTLLRTATERLLPLAENEAALERASYAAGRASLGDVLAAQVALAEAQLEHLNREAAVARDAVRLNLTYGSDR